MESIPRGSLGSVRSTLPGSGVLTICFFVIPSIPWTLSYPQSFCHKTILTIYPFTSFRGGLQTLRAAVHWSDYLGAVELHRCLGATGFDGLVEAVVACRGPRLAS